MLNALTNTSGGLLILHCGKSAVSKDKDKWLQAFKAFVTIRWISSDLYRSLVTVKYKTINEQLYLFLFVEKSPRLVTFSFYAYGRHAAGKDLITSEDEVKKIDTKDSRRETRKAQITSRRSTLRK